MRATVITTRLFRLSRRQLPEFNEKTKNREYNKDRRKDLSYFSFSFSMYWEYVCMCNVCMYVCDICMYDFRTLRLEVRNRMK